MSTQQPAVPSAPPPEYSDAQNLPSTDYPGAPNMPPPYIPQPTEGVCKECIPLHMHGSAQLGYIDIQPKCLDPGSFEFKKPPVFEPFSNLIQVANAWLRNNPSMAVVKCETTERKLQKFIPNENQIFQAQTNPLASAPVTISKEPQSSSQVRRSQTLTYDIDCLLKHEAPGGAGSFIKGLRVWLRDKPPDSPAQQIGMLDTVPDEETVDIPQGPTFSDPFFVQGDKVMSYVPKAMNYKHHITFKGLQETVHKLNNKLEKHPISGDILNLEVVTFRRQFEESVSRDLDPNQTSFMVNLDNVTRYTKVIRLYYICGSANFGDKIGVHALVPQVTKLPGANSVIGRPQFQKESQMYASLATWLGQNQGIVIRSILQTSVRYYYQTSADKVYIAWDSMDDLKEPYTEEALLYSRIIFYTRPSSGPAPPINCLTSRVFMPLRVGLRSYENMGQTIERINAWLRVTGLPVYQIETMEMFFTENDKQGVNTDKTDYVFRPTFSTHFVVAFKLYFTSFFQEPDPRTQPPTIDWMTQGESMSCQIL